MCDDPEIYIRVMLNSRKQEEDAGEDCNGLVVNEDLDVVYQSFNQISIDKRTRKTTNKKMFDLT